MARISRRSARVLPVSVTGEVLLVQDTDPGDAGKGAYWASVGGAIDPDEQPAEAASRELWEETGIRAAPGALVGPIHVHDSRFSWNGVDYAGNNTYFAVRVDRDVEISFANLEPVEITSMLGVGWWTPEDLRADGAGTTEFLADIMELAVDAVRGDQ